LYTLLTYTYIQTVLMVFDKVSRLDWLILYKNLIKCAKSYPAYSYREYALRRIRHQFQLVKNQHLDPGLAEKQFRLTTDELKSLQRQVQVGQLYASPKLIIESAAEEKKIC